MRRWLGWLLVATATTAMASTDEELVEQLDHWLEEPLDLRQATAEQIGLLPWITAQEAEAIVGLREEGGLRRWSDLTLVAGLDAARLAAIEPFVHLPDAGPSWGAGRFEAFQRSRTGGTRHWGWARWSGPIAQGALRWDPQQPSRGWVSGRWASGEMLVGDVLLDDGTVWAWSSVRGRSRTAPVSVRPRLRVRGGGLTSNWRGLAVRQQFGPVVLAGGAGRGDDVVVMAELEAAGRRVGAGWFPAGPRTRQALWLAADDELAWRTEVVREPDGWWRLAAASTWRAPGWRAGLALSHGPGSSAEAFDPITGQMLDRPHRAVQVHGARLLAGWRVQALARRVWRGAGLAEIVRDRTEWVLEGRHAGHSWRTNLRVDRASEAAPEIVWSARWAEEMGAGRRLGVRWGLRDTRTSVLLTAGVQRGRRLRWQVWIAGAGGDLSSLWLTGIGGGPPLSQWLSPGGYAAVVAVAHEAASGWTGSLWAALEIDPGAGALPQAGARIVALWPGRDTSGAKVAGH